MSASSREVGVIEGETHLPGRRPTPTVSVGGVMIGSRHPVVVQSMTNTDTADADATTLQVAALAHAGSELVRITVNNDAAAAAVPVIRRKLDDLGVGVPLIGDFHYNGHQLLVEYPVMAAALAKYRINPGNVGGKRRDENFATIIRVGARARPPGAHRGQLGIARPEAAHPADGRERALGRTRRRSRRDDRGDDPVRAALGRAWPRRRAWPTTGSSSVPRSAACATWSTSTGGWRCAATTRSISG